MCEALCVWLLVLFKHLGNYCDEVRSCAMAERNHLSLRVINGEQATLSSLNSLQSGSSCLARKFLAPSEWQNITVHTVTQFSPSPLISCTQSMPQGATVSQITAANSEQSCDQSTSSSVLRDVHISARLMEDFLQLAKDNTEKDLETCGTLGAFLKNETFYVTTLIIPKQESTSNSCQATNDEEVFAIQNEQSLFPVGWIHVMVPEAFAIVMAPTDTSRSYGIFRLSDPGGMSVLKECQETGFHTHEETGDGSPIYEHCSNVYTNSNLRFEIFDLR
ncbi:AMSH-like ubiquitin thioesterase 2 isoform X3 [Rosa chinensis]|uniref:AMSH-like ubiquitin thioesterase 2 isoform X3 n=1 Tax=Rosa chinensis TaxID=74649 RepID=UPI001AD8AF3B|nr:AMSH-like ubiquitin thioesterase 2 isoform X3 [Rosa chinensis]